MTRSPFRAALMAIFATVAVLLAACGVESRGAEPSTSGGGTDSTEVAGDETSGSEVPETDGPEDFQGTGGAMFLREAAETTSSVSTQKFEIVLDMDGGPMSMSMSMDGAIDLDEELLEMTMNIGDLDVGDLGGDEMDGFDASMLAMTMVFAGDTVYIKSPMLTMFADSDAEWIATPVDELEDSDGPMESPLGNTQDPTAFLDFLRGTDSEVTEVGREDVRGVSTTHFATVLNVRGIIDAADTDEKADMEEALEAFGDQIDELPMDVWIDDDGMVRRMEMAFDFDEEGISGSMTMTIELFDFDEPVDIRVPDPSDVMDMDDAGFGAFDF